MDETKNFHTKWSKSDGEGQVQVPNDVTYVRTLNGAQTNVTRMHPWRIRADVRQNQCNIVEWLASSENKQI